MTAEARTRRKLYYVYALTDQALPQRLVVGGRILHAVDIAGVGAIVETSREARPATEAALREQHAIVVALARRVNALLPVRFGALFTAAELDARVKSAHDVILSALGHVRDRVQMTVRVHSAPARSARTSAASSGTAYMRARSERHMAVRRSAARIHRAVAPFVVDERVDAGKGGLQGTVYHLINTEDIRPYRAALQQLAPSRPPLRLSVTGPWPVFAFVPELRRA